MARSPIWKSITATLTAEIAGGQYRAGDKLPTEAELSQRFGVNRHTLRRALSDMAGAGLVVARRGAGVFVQGRPTDYALGRRTRFHQNVLASGRTPSRQTLRLETRKADAREAEALALPLGALVHVFEGLSLADGVPLAMFRSVFPAARFANLLIALSKSPSVTAAFTACGLQDYTRAATRLTAKTADALQALHLRLPEGAPLLRSVAVNVDAEGQAVEYGITWFSGDRVTLTVQSD